MSNKEKRIKIFCLAIFLSALGNALPAFSGAGAAPWTAAAINLGVLFNLKMGTALNVYFIGFFIFNKIYTKEKLEPKKDLALLIFVILFGVLINIIINALHILPIETSNQIYMAMLSLFGSILLAAAIALFIKANVLILPIDDFIKNLTTICKGNFIASGLISFGLGVIFAVIFGLLHGKILAINYITIINLLFFGSVLNYFNKKFTFVDEYIEKGL